MGEFIETVKTIGRAARMAGAGWPFKAALAEQARLEREVIALRAVTRPEDWDGVVDEVARRASRMVAADAVQSVARDVAMGWRPSAGLVGEEQQ